MCLALPGQILDIDHGDDPLLRNGRISFAGVVKTANLAYVPEAGVGDYVIVHAGFAISLLDEAEAQASLREFAALAELNAAHAMP
ncbi:MAG: HypC/HybG/HupF family hydrogenase formation chaperone [Methylococcaceae bacterium]|nr:MAG: HypC/HybG/HupF family hydrogenase formation chaperone [Methylococcaceae bacterium]